jgi:poly[(R)-3-hydroxyalkanoate] polymerase subunit PhaC
MVRSVGEQDPETARAALNGLAAYERARRLVPRPAMPIASRMGPAVLRDHGGDGPPAVLVPSLINPPHVLDLDEEVSLASAVSRMGRRALLLDWGPARERADLDVGRHVSELLVPLIESLEQHAALVGYCLGGTMAIAAANLVEVERVCAIASPWSFAGYSNQSRNSVGDLWRAARHAALALNLLPMEVLQAAFWSLDPKRTVSKFARFSLLDPDSDDARRFVILEDWANDGEPLPLPGARELIEDFFGKDLPGRGEWTVAGKTISDSLSVPLLNLTASQDRITPAESAGAGSRENIPSGHVGMVVGSARGQLHRSLSRFLDAACR